MKLKEVFIYEMESGNADKEVTVRPIYQEEILFKGPFKELKNIGENLLNEEILSISEFENGVPKYIILETEQKVETERPNEMVNNTTIRVPKKYQHMLEEVDQDGDGYWAYAREGYIFKGMGCRTAHEYTQKELLEMIRTLEPEKQ